MLLTILYHKTKELYRGYGRRNGCILVLAVLVVGVVLLVVGIVVALLILLPLALGITRITIPAAQICF